MMNPMRISDNTAKPKEEFSSIPHLTSHIANQTLGQLAGEGLFVFPEIWKDSESLSKEQMILQSINGNYRTSNVMGLLGYESEQLLITSRFGSEEDYFFFYLLEKVVGLPDMVHLNATASNDHRLLDLLIFLFPYCLKQAMRKGPYKEYICRRENDANLKGTIDIARHIKENTPFLGSIAYRHREFSYDNRLMELIRHTIECIKRKPYGPLLLRPVKSEVESVIVATPGYTPYERQRVILQNKKNPVRHAYFNEYRTLQKLCLAILSQEKQDINSGPQWLHGILFDGAWLWEEYVNQLISETFYHPQNKSLKNGQRLFSSSAGLIYPDFISRSAHNRIIADAKYKPATNIHGPDYLQLLAYMFRFDARTGYYLYPASADDEAKTFHLNSGSTYEGNVTPREDIRVIKHGLQIPAHATSYGDFKEQIKISEQEFIRPLLK